MVTLADIRSSFLQFFAERGHTIVPSSPLVPHNDPTLMFTNSGMVQFKDLFTGREKRDYSRATTSQKCVRAGGKHNDLENVGYTARHHTFFEMLGNFSFGDYFKEEAIVWAWDFLTKELGLSKDKLYLTVYHTDDEARRIWKQCTGFSDERIINIATDDNFWYMGDSGPCGPCSEIFYDHGASVAGGLPGTPTADGDRYVEIWNLVFTQFNQQPSGEKIAIPRPCIDTGSGLERLTAVLQGVHSNYEIDLFASIIDATESVIGRHSTGDARHSFHVIADHLRAASFLIADGVLPSNEGRGYVMRRIIRRAVRHAHLLGWEKPLLAPLSGTLETLMGTAYPELVRARALIQATLQAEEVRFHETLARGLRLLDEVSSQAGTSKVLPGDVAFKLYDTYGFPLDLTDDIMRHKQMTVDHAAFAQCMNAQKERARKAWKGSGEAHIETAWFELYESCGATEFLGYDTHKASAIVTGLLHKGVPVSTLTAPCSDAWMVVNQTPFYGESGGQMGDHGLATTADGRQLIISDTQKPLPQVIAHKITLTEGALSLGDEVNLSIHEAHRHALQANHSVTHLLHAELRAVLGTHVAQKGSLVGAERLRFDFSHMKALTSDELQSIETRVNHLIRANLMRVTRTMAYEDALAQGAIGLFGEKYSQEVRVVSFEGLCPSYDDSPCTPTSSSASTELCGGTHVTRTGDIGFFKIVSEVAIAAGVRRIEALTGQEALAYVQSLEQQCQQVAQLLHDAKENIVPRVTQLVADITQLRKQNNALEESAMIHRLAQAPMESRAAYALQYSDCGSGSAKTLRSALMAYMEKKHNRVVIVNLQDQEKRVLMVAMSRDISARAPANRSIQHIGQSYAITGGGGTATLATTALPVTIPPSSIPPLVHEWLETQLQ